MSALVRDRARAAAPDVNAMTDTEWHAYFQGLLAKIRRQLAELPPLPSQRAARPDLTVIDGGVE